MERSGQIPRRLSLTPSCVVWDLAEVQVWLIRRRQVFNEGLVEACSSPAHSNIRPLRRRAGGRYRDPILKARFRPYYGPLLRADSECPFAAFERNSRTTSYIPGSNVAKDRASSRYARGAGSWRMAS
ncbi:MAG: AlpA family transcriptional regulator [Alphaproteobacteria bacterium]|nr:AlpA family transcriptional regulator [Alphaproteobacteria bacterium]MBU1515141.1 AlpA family transcriptional regulator [Alphaproteobacteria bacterium]MBU2092271.1 AlpA family transcriptional regulator [Alphaproteobacteria bacterium]MBU2152865.1 AlpA family transcriptional regulator [Alphaproteobacteria bacterium]MBU2305696.1 AlpA family transcriptional regulator [Alphaproteobacteria bacterium]